jgi:hypothetical protein
MSTNDTSTINGLFGSALADSSELTKLGEAGGAFIRQKLRELSFARKIMPPVMVTRADCQRSEDHDGLSKIVDLEPDSKAMPISWRGQPDGKYVNGPRYTLNFFTVSSDRFSKTEQELLSYEMPITKVIEENSVKDIQKVEDVNFLAHVEAAIVLSGNSVTVADTSVTRNALIQGFKLLTDKELKCDCILMHQSDFNDVLAFEATDVGDRIASEITVDGYKYDTLLGRKLITSIKDGVVPKGTIYFFAAPQFLGNFFILNQTKFWIEKRANLIEWQSWEDIAMGIGNVNACAKVNLS